MDLPHHACFGDGSPLEEADLNQIRAAMIAEERVFDWQAGDVLLVDNILVMHGRRPFLGERRVLVSLGQWASSTQREMQPHSALQQRGVAVSV